MLTAVTWKSHLQFLTEKEVESLHEASLKILQDTGVYMPVNTERLEQLQDFGLKVDREQHRVYFPPEIVHQSLGKAPGTYSLYARNPEYDLQLDGKHGYLTLDGSGLQIIDIHSGQPRKSTKADLEAAIRVADYLPQISFLWPCISAQDQKSSIQGLYELEAMLVNSGKHIQAMTAVDPINAKGSVEIAAAVAGGKAALKERPIISNFQCSISPLAYDAQGLEAALIFAEAGIPVGFMTMQIGCSTAPATLAGNIALGNAEIIAGIVFLQLFYPGTPTFYGSCATMMELKRGGVTCGGPEDFLLQAASAQMARHYKIPANIGTFATGAKASDWHAGVENAISGAVSMFAHADMMCGAGLVNGAKFFSFEQLLLDCEIFEILRTVNRGLEVNETTLALDVIEHVGPQNHFMLEQHTLNNMYKVWQPSILDRSSYEEWEEQGKPAPDKIANALAREILAKHKPVPPDNYAEVQEILACYEEEYISR